MSNTNVNNQIYEFLKKGILFNEIKVGSKLVIPELEAKFNSNKNTIQEAINKLHLDGLVSSIQKDGSYTIEYNCEFFIEINEIIVGILNTGIKLSMRKFDSKLLYEYLTKYIQLQEEYIDDDKFFLYDCKFHQAFVDFSYNSHLKELFEKYNILNEALIRHYHNSQIASIREGSIKKHKEIAEAFLKNDLAKTIKLNEEHFESVETIFKII